MLWCGRSSLRATLKTGKTRISGCFLSRYPFNNRLSMREKSLDRGYLTVLKSLRLRELRSISLKTSVCLVSRLFEWNACVSGKMASRSGAGAPQSQAGFPGENRVSQQPAIQEGNSMKNTLRWVLLLVLFTVASGPALAQSTDSAGIRGTVIGPAGPEEIIVFNLQFSQIARFEPGVSPPSSRLIDSLEDFP